MTEEFARAAPANYTAAAGGAPRWFGVFTAIPRGWRGTSPTGPQTISYRALQRSALQVGMPMVVFRPEGLRLLTNGVHGYRWSGRRQQWVRVTAPMPAVIYNRVPRRQTEAEPAVQWALRYLRDRGIPLFNPSFLDKWEVHQLLSRDAFCRNHLPATRLLNRGQDVVEALGDWRSLVLKPAAGSLGRGVIFVGVSDRHGSIRVNAHVRRRHVRGRHRDPAALLRFLRRNVKRRPYLIQQAIRRVTYQGRPVDIRVLVQRNATGQWVLTGMGARVAGWGRGITHVPQGGMKTRADLALAPSFDPPALERVQRSITEVALQAGRALQQQSGELFGELSLDLAIDGQGHVWILECNAKPFRFDEPAIRRQARRNIVQFAHYLATRGFQTERLNGSGLDS